MYCRDVCVCACGCAWQVSPKDLREAAEALIKALMIREKYMAMALHSFPRTVAVFLQRLDRQAPLNDVQHEEPKTIEGTSTAYVRTYVPPQQLQLLCASVFAGNTYPRYT